MTGSIDLTRLASLTSATRLYDFWIDTPAELYIEAFHGFGALSELYNYEVLCLSPDAHIALETLTGRQAAILPLLSDGTRTRLSGYIQRAAREDSEGGYCRYRLTLVPGLWLASQSQHSRVFQDQSVLAIIDAVLAPYRPRIEWAHAPELAQFVAELRPRAYCVQYRESDLNFVNRILAEEGIGYYLEEIPERTLNDPGEQALNRLVLFADSTRFPQDPQSDQSGAIRYHRAASQEHHDAIQTFGATRRLQAALTTLASYDYKPKRSTAASLSTHQPIGGAHAPRLEAYDYPGPYAFATTAEAEHYAKLQRQALEARAKTYHGQSSVRSFTPGRWFKLSDSFLEYGSTPTELRYSLTHVEQLGINNLPRPDQARLKPPVFSRPPSAELLEPAQARGYANSFQAVRADLPWRPILHDQTGQRLNPKPSALGPQTALVVGPNGESEAHGADELHTDRLGRIQVRFHWQHGHTRQDQSSCWLRVAQRAAGNRIGSQFLPRIGQEVLVIFLDHDIDRPLVLAGLYNGRGEGNQNERLYAQAGDRRASAQGNETQGHAPPWHAAASAHRHAGALSGFKSKEFGGWGYSQLVFDDSDSQLRSQLKTTQTHAELNLGHLIHQADNYRGSFRGLGFELRSDAYGALRAARGLHITSFQAKTQAAGEQTAASALIEQASQLAHSYSVSASVHLGVSYASVRGANQANQSALSDQASFLSALVKTSQAKVDGAKLEQALNDANQGGTQTKESVPHSADPILTLAAQAGLGLNAQNLHLTSGETIHASSGSDTGLAVGKQLRMHSGQALGFVSAVQAAQDQVGLQVKAAQGDIDIQAQSDTLQVQAKDDISLNSVQADIDFAAAKSITLNTAAGAYIKIEGGNIEIHCPGKITVQASRKPFAGPDNQNYPLSQFPRGTLKYDEKFRLVDLAGTPVANMRYELIKSGGGRFEGVSDAQGMIPLQDGFHPENVKINLLGKVKKSST